MYGTRGRTVSGVTERRGVHAAETKGIQRRGSLIAAVNSEYEGGKRAMIVHTWGAGGARGGNWFSVCLFDWSTVSYICTWIVPQPPRRGMGRCREWRGRWWLRGGGKLIVKSAPRKTANQLKGQDRCSGSRNVECLAWRVALPCRESREGKKKSRTEEGPFVCARVYMTQHCSQIRLNHALIFRPTLIRPNYVHRDYVKQSNFYKDYGNPITTVVRPMRSNVVLYYLDF